MAEDKEAKHGGHKNGRRGGISGGSFFTWFMVIALLGVWTSVAVVWFDLVDYEEVLAKAKDFRYNLSEVLQGKLGVYDADGDGDFDVGDAKVLLEGPGGLAKRKTKAKAKETSKEDLKKEREKVVSSKEDLKKEREKVVSSKEDLKKEREKVVPSKSEERTSGKKKEEDKKGKKADSDTSRKTSPRGKKDREAEKANPDRSAKSRENLKKGAETKAVPSKVASRDKGDKKGRNSSGSAHVPKDSNQKRKN
ncbi:aspartyl/asparaginyl beta-hydroxylase isoform X7 [Chionomys nivalis]|uniref:aspartyl/asparaginyl beta-hydroxylase isoform X7 n=1 Tax=Chionomys nivalis TaxID=269649 RepID=UPI00259A205E|nr:aspartyl/asparaginyl beta-hydroxylase isoform X7 [Chionomys nivalis]